MPDTTLITYRDHDKTWRRPTGKRHRFALRNLHGYILEVEDLHFHYNSAVMMPDYKPGEPDAHEPERYRVTGLAVLRACYLHARDNPDQSLLIAGHTDTSGQAAYNCGLSQLRADNVLCALEGNREGWVEISNSKHRVEDYQQILKWAAETRGWSCDPGPVDNSPGRRTTAAVTAFQSAYNREFGTALAEDGLMGRQTWGAFFDVYMAELRRILAAEGHDLEALRAQLAYVDSGRKAVGCGENFPVEAKRRDNYRSKANRRVEILFFDPEEKPHLTCPAGGGQCALERCAIYKPGLYDFEHIDCRPITSRVWLDLQTVDELGTCLPNSALLLTPEGEQPRQCSTDERGYLREADVPPGVVTVTLADGTPVYYEREHELVVARLNTEHQAATVTRLVLRDRVAQRLLKYHKDELENYRPLPIPREVVLSRRNRHIQEMLPGQQPVDPDHLEEPANASPPFEPGAPVESPGPEDHAVHARRVTTFLATDNLAVAAGWSGGQMNMSKFMDLLSQWLQDYYPTAGERGFFVYTLSPSEIVFYDGAQAATRFAVDESYLCPIGAYTSFEDLGDRLFRDMTYRRYFIEGAGETGTPFYRLAADEAGCRNERARRAPQVGVLYCLPETAGQLSQLARLGASGVLEPYPPGDQARRQRVHERNLATVRACGAAYRRELDLYVGDVRRAGETERVQGDQIAAEDALRALGPPPEPYGFPSPPGIDRDSEGQLQRAYATAGANSAPGWNAVNARIAQITNTHAEGAVFLRITFAATTPADPDWFPDTPIQGIGQLQLTYNFDLGTDGYRATDEKTVVIGPGPAGHLLDGLTEKYNVQIPGSGSVEHQVNLESGDETMVVKLGTTFGGVEITDDGTYTITYAGRSHSFNVRTGSNVFNFASLGIPGLATMAVSFGWQANDQDTLQRILLNAPGFFECRTTQQLLLHTHWSDLSWDEKANLAALGWERKNWDIRTYLYKSDIEFPHQCQKPKHLLSWAERRAIIHLRLGFTNWPSCWNSVVIGEQRPPDSPGPPLIDDQPPSTSG
ncbi:MAG: hypothetical protein KKB50_15130 [Planctomycetes bacterium]|nr:hypothetical protein [Planctomycetota bacterium]